jgi:hypothetical protein
MWATRTNDLALIHLHPEDDGGLSSDERVVPGATSVGVPYFVDGLAVNSSGLMVTDEGALVTTARAIAILSPDGGMESLPFDGPFAGSDSDALWLSRRDNYSPITTLSAIGWTDAGVREATLPLPSGPLGDYRTFVSPSNTVVGSFPPILRGAIVPRFEAGHIALEAYDPGEGYAPVSSATRRHAFARSLDGGAVKIFDR